MMLPQRLHPMVVLGVSVCFLALPTSQSYDNNNATVADNNSMLQPASQSQEAFSSAVIDAANITHKAASNPVLPICESFASAFAKAAADYTQCFIANARPTHLCTKCVGGYLKVIQAYRELDQVVDTSVVAGRQVKKTCRDWILNADRVMAIQQTRSFFQTLWEDSRCDNCFANSTWDANVTHPIAEHTKTFDNMNTNLTKCFDNFTMQPLLNVSDPVGQSKACNICKNAYGNISQYYSTLNTKYGDKLCMDIVDAMNYTRLVWGSDFNCTGNTRQDGITITITGLFFVLPAVFYIGSHIHYQRIEKKIVQQKRMRRSRHPSSHAPTRPETPVILEPEASTGTGPGIFQRMRNPSPAPTNVST